MKNYILLFCILFTTLPSWSLEPIFSTIEKATIFPNGATIHRIGKVSISKGTSTFLIDNLPLDIDEATVTIKLPKSALLLSHKIQQEYISLDKIETTRFQKEQIITDSISFLDLQIVTLNGQEHILNENRQLTVSENSTFTTSELRELNTFYGQEMLEIKKKLFHLGLQKRSLQEELKAVIAHAQQNGQKAMNGKGQLLLEVASEINQSIDIQFSYFTSKAGWLPNYDLRVEGLQKGIEIVYKASVFQNTGEDWDKIQLSLSNAEPLANYALPVLQTYHLNYNNFYHSDQVNFRAVNGLVRGKVIDGKTNEPLIGANVIIQGTTVGTATDIDGHFSLNIPDGHKFLTISYTGYGTKTIAIDAQNLFIPLESSMLLDEVVVTGYGGKTRNRNGPNEKKQEQQAIPTSITRSQTSFVYKIDVPYSIPSGTNKKTVLVKKEKVPATFEYITMPKIVETAFLTANIPNWQQLNLLPGSANIFLDNTYAGKTYLETNPTEDDYIVSLGKDDNVIVQRTLQTDYQRKRFIGNNIEENRKWVLTVRNNKATPINIKIMDQYPISQNSSIKVSIEETSKAEEYKPDGLLSWTTTLASNKQWKGILAYKVKYSKNKQLIVD